MHPFERFVGNIGGLWSWIQSYATYPLMGLFIIGMIYGLKKHRAKTVYLSLWFLVPFLALASFGKVLYPRYLLFMLAPLLPIVALGISKIAQWKPCRHLPICLFVYLSTILYPSYFSYLIIFNPLDSPLPKVDRFQLLDDWPSGYGINEVVDFIKLRSMNENIFVGTEGTFGLTPAALNIYLKDNKNVEVKGYWPVDTSIQELTEIAKTGKPTFLLLKDTQLPKPEWPVKIVGKWRKGKGEAFSILLEFISK